MRYGFVLPHRSPRPLDLDEIVDVAQRAEAAGFADLWVTENTLDRAYSLDPFVILSYAAAVTSRIGLGVSMSIVNTHSPVRIAHQAASLDFVSGGRFTLGVALGRVAHYHDFQVPEERPVRRFREAVQIIRDLGTDQALQYSGEIFHLVHQADDIAEHGMMTLTRAQRRLPIWMGGVSDQAMQRAALLSDGWMGNGGQSSSSFASRVAVLRRLLNELGRDPDTFPVSKRVFLAIDHDPATARTELESWFAAVYGRPEMVDAAGVYGTLESVAAQLGDLVAAGANHLLLNPVSRFTEQLDALSEELCVTGAN